MKGLEHRIQHQQQVFTENEFLMQVDAYEKATSEFFSQDVSELAQALTEHYICDLKTGRIILPTSTEAWDTQKVGNRYNAMNNMNVGDYYAFYYPFRKMTQSLIVAQEQGVEIITEDQKVKKTCVRILGAARVDFTTNNLVPLEDREGAVAEYLEIGQQEDPEDPKRKLSEVKSLVFLDESNVLYLIPKPKININDSGTSPISPESANKLLDSFFE